MQHTPVTAANTNTDKFLCIS